jgi:predicted transcriptional regulator
MAKKRAPVRSELSRRERQIVDAVYRLGPASAVEIRDAIPEPPSYTAVRTLLGILLEKGHLRAEAVGGKNIYEPTVPRDEMAKSVIDSVLANFFEGSVERVVATLLDREEIRLSDEELTRLAELVEQARREGR